MQCDLPNALLCDSISLSDISVRYGRVPKRSRELSGTSDEQNNRVSTPGTTNTSTTQAPQMCSVASPQDAGCSNQATPSTSAENTEIIPPITMELSIYDVIVCIAEAHRLYCTYTEEQTRELVRRPIVVPNNGPEIDESAAAADRREQQKIWLWQLFASRMTPGVQRVVEFAKRVPGFCDFIQDDQLILIKMGFFEVWITQASRMINETAFTFDDGVYLTRQHLEILYDEDFVTSLVNITNAINAHNLNDTEIALYSVIVLLAYERPGITEDQLIMHTREFITEALRVQLVRSRNGSVEASQILPALEALIPDFRTLGTSHSAHLDWLRMNWTRLRLPPLFSELFDIPKDEEAAVAATSAGISASSDR